MLKKEYNLLYLKRNYFNNDNNMTKTPQWLQDFNKLLLNVGLRDYDKRQKVIKAVLNILKSFKKKWEEKQKQKQSTLL